MPRPSRHMVSPVGLVVDTVSIEGERVVVSAHPIAVDAACTGCGQISARVHSHYERQLQDLPAHGRGVQLRIRVRRFRCGNAACNCRIFGELLGAGVAEKAARRTARLDGIVHQLGVALAGSFELGDHDGACLLVALPLGCIDRG